MKSGPELLELLHERADRLSEWWPLLSVPYENLLSRPSEMEGATVGWDPSPGTRPCEHRLEWQRGKLCLGCDNTGWRPLAPGERKEGFGIDPYAGNLLKGAVVVRESDSSRRAREGERIDSIISGLKRDARLRAGAEVREDSSMRAVRLVSRKPKTARKILRGLEILKQTKPELYDSLPSRRGFVALALVMYRYTPGPILAP